MSIQDKETPQEWLARQFEFEYCAECGGDAPHHTVTGLLGNYFAYCNFGPSAETDWEFHPVIKNFRAERAQ